MRSHFVSLFVALQFLITSCIHTAKNENKNLEMQEPALTENSVQQFGDLQIQTFIYDDGKLPLEDFFSRLKRGDYKNMFRQIHLDYKPSNVKNQVLEDLIDQGFRPTYVRVRNTGPHARHITEKDFLWVHQDAKKNTRAFSSPSLPKEFGHFSPKALAANVYNTGVVVTGFAAYMAAFIVVTAGKGGPTPGMFPEMLGDGEVYNPVQKITTVNYQNYLLNEQILQPGQTAQGLLIFYVGDDFDISKTKIIFDQYVEI